VDVAAAPRDRRPQARPQGDPQVTTDNLGDACPTTPTS
jgi:hypothetical protein